MPATKRIDKEMILSSALALLEREGSAAVNARSVAMELGCSTQPIYVSFASMDELMEALFAKGQSIYMEYAGKGFKEYGNYFVGFLMGFAKFAKDHPKVYRYVYLERPNQNRADEKAFQDWVIDLLINKIGYDEKVAKHFYLHASVYAHGVAGQIATGRGTWDMPTIEEMIKEEYEALKKEYANNEQSD